MAVSFQITNTKYFDSTHSETNDIFIILDQFPSLVRGMENISPLTPHCERGVLEGQPGK